MSNNFHLQLYRGTTQQNNAYTGPAGELTVDTTLSKLRLHDGSTAGGIEIGGMPTGSIIPYAGSTAPAGYLLCDGSAISRTTYSALFSAIGTTYGAGDGNSTFNLPTENDCFPSFPSNNYINLTLSDSGSIYTAPANGYFQLAVLSGKMIQFYNKSKSEFWKASISQDEAFAETIECQKGDTVQCYYTYTTFRWFRFYYAQGQMSIIKI